MIDAELYRVFFIVSTCGTISKASKRLFVSQPAISKSIKKLEELTSCTLFYRSSKGVVLTTEGQILFDYVARGFEQLDNGEKILKKLLNRETGLVKIGISSTLCRHVLIPHLRLFHKEYPGIKVNIVNRTSTETLQHLSEGRVDVCIVSEPDEKRGLKCHELLEINDVLVAVKEIAGQLPTPLPVRQLTKQRLMMLEQGNATRAYLETFFKENGVLLQVENEISNMDFLIDFAKIGIGIAPVIEAFVKDELKRGVLEKIELHPHIPPRKVVAAYQESIPLSTAAATFVSSLCRERG